MTTKRYESQKRAELKYQKEKTKTLTVRFFPSDMELLDYIKSHDNATKYIKDLVREERERSGQAG